MGVYGYEKNTTPNIDKWAKDAYVFTNAFTNVPHTYPSFAELMTGKHALNSRIYISIKDQTPISDNVDTMASILKKNNYSTAAFVSNSFLQAKMSNMNKGFDSYQYIPYWTSSDSNYEKIISNARNWIKNNKGNPFFLWVHLMDPHAPYEPPKDLRCKFNNILCNQLQNDDQVKKIEEMRHKYEFCRSETPPKDTIELIKTLYDGEIASADNQTKKILDTLQESGLDKNTIVVIYGDHGEGFDHNYYFGHGRILYNSSVKIPFILKYPQIASKQNKINQMLDNTDIFATLMDMLDITIDNKAIDGVSYKYLLSDNDFINELFQNKYLHPNIKKTTVLVNHALDKFAIYDGQYKYILSNKNNWFTRTIDEDNKYCLNNNQTEELYNTRIDPLEENNILKNNPKITTELKHQLLERLSKANLPRPQYNGSDNLNNSASPASPSGEEKHDENLEKMKSLGY